jgi:hypothetical protein
MTKLSKCVPGLTSAGYSDGRWALVGVRGKLRICLARVVVEVDDGGEGLGYVRRT